jgi:hypothetical protein
MRPWGGNNNETLVIENSKFHMKLIAVAITATTVATMGSAQAAPTTFTFNASDDNKTSILKSLDGINLTIGNFLTGPVSGADTDGLAVFCRSAPCGPPDSQAYSSYTMTFDQPVKLISYNISYLQQASGIATTYSQNVLQSIQSNNSTTGLKLFSNQFIAQPNVPISVSSSDSASQGFPLYQINAFTVEKVDVPGPLPLAGAAAAFSWSRRLRGRISRTARV